MKTLRQAVTADKQQFRNLWDISFNDTKEFSDWLFDTRFVPQYSAVIEEDNGFISSEVQSLPICLRVRDELIPSAIMIGACTHPDFKRRGYMKELYTYYMNMVREMGIVLCPHTPAVLKTYFYVGHYPVSDTAFIKTDFSEGAQVSGDIVIKDLKGNLGDIFECYNIAASKFSGIAYRSYADFKLKCADYAVCSAKCACVLKDNKVMAYAIYFDEKDMIYGEEIMSLDELSEQKIVNFLFNEGKCRKVTVKLPPSTKSEYNNGIKSVAPRNVCGIADVSALLKAVGKGLGYTIEIKDEAVKGNNGVFDFSGNATDKKPQLLMPVYRFAQWIFGYKSLEEIRKGEDIEIFDEKAFDELNKLFPKLNCHIIDEY